MGGKNTGLDQDSEILIDQLRAVDNLRFLEKLGSIENEKVQELKEKLGLVLDFWNLVFVSKILFVRILEYVEKRVDNQ